MIVKKKVFKWEINITDTFFKTHVFGNHMQRYFEKPYVFGNTIKYLLLNDGCRENWYEYQYNCAN